MKNEVRMKQIASLIRSSCMAVSVSALGLCEVKEENSLLISARSRKRYCAAAIAWVSTA
jgi:hypothetical protein